MNQIAKFPAGLWLAAMIITVIMVGCGGGGALAPGGLPGGPAGASNTGTLALAVHWPSASIAGSVVSNDNTSTGGEPGTKLATIPSDTTTIDVSVYTSDMAAKLGSVQISRDPNASTATATVIDLPAGPVLVKVTALDAGGSTLATGSVEVSIVAGSTVNTSVSLSPSSSPTPTGLPSDVTGQIEFHNGVSGPFASGLSSAIVNTQFVEVSMLYASTSYTTFQVTDPDGTTRPLGTPTPKPTIQAGGSYLYGTPPTAIPVSTSRRVPPETDMRKEHVSFVPATVAGTYTITASGPSLPTKTATVSPSFSYPPALTLNAPVVDTGGIHLSWNSLGAGYNYMVTAKHLIDLNDNTDVVWQEINLFYIDWSNLAATFATFGTATTGTILTIPPGIFPSGSNVKINISGFIVPAVPDNGVFVVPLSEDETSIVMPIP